MKANELMIGDWVMVDDIEHTHPLQVAEIFNKCGAYYVTLYWDGMPDNVNPQTLVADVDKVFPIPLTQEILEKNGFVLKPDGWIWCDCDGIEDQNYIFIQFRKGCDEVRLIELNFVNNVLAKFQKIQFVHELQHALRLCGIEKEIVL